MSSSSASSAVKLFIFGVTGQLGQQLIRTLQTDKVLGKFEVSVLLRPAAPKPAGDSKDAAAAAAELKKSAGVEQLKSFKGVIRTLDGDAGEASVAQIAEWIRGSDVVLSLVRSYGRSVDFKILEAVQAAGVPFFVPSLYGADVTTAHIDQLPPLQGKRQVVEAVKAAGAASGGKLNYILIQIGLFMEFLPTPFNGVDLEKGVITAPYSLDTKITTLTIPNFTEVLVELLLQRNEARVKNQAVYLGGDTTSYSQLKHLCEERFSKPFTASVRSKEDLQAAVAADKTFQNLIARFSVMYGEQKGVFWPIDHTWNALHAKHVALTTVKDHLHSLKL